MKKKKRDSYVKSSDSDSFRDVEGSATDIPLAQRASVDRRSKAVDVPSQVLSQSSPFQQKSFLIKKLRASFKKLRESRTFSKWKLRDSVRINRRRPTKEEAEDFLSLAVVDGFIELEDGATEEGNCYQFTADAYERFGAEIDKIDDQKKARNIQSTVGWASKEEFKNEVLAIVKEFYLSNVRTDDKKTEETAERAQSSVSIEPHSDITPIPQQEGRKLAKRTVSQQLQMTDSDRVAIKNIKVGLKRKFGVGNPAKYSMIRLTIGQSLKTSTLPKTITEIFNQLVISGFLECKNPQEKEQDRRLYIIVAEKSKIA